MKMIKRMWYQFALVLTSFTLLPLFTIYEGFCEIHNGDIDGLDWNPFTHFYNSDDDPDDGDFPDDFPEY
jgi:hypothetical protein